MKFILFSALLVALATTGAQAQAQPALTPGKSLQDVAHPGLVIMGPMQDPPQPRIANRSFGTFDPGPGIQIQQGPNYTLYQWRLPLAESVQNSRTASRKKASGLKLTSFEGLYVTARYTFGDGYYTPLYSGFPFRFHPGASSLEPAFAFKNKNHWTGYVQPQTRFHSWIGPTF